MSIANGLDAFNMPVTNGQDINGVFTLQNTTWTVDSAGTPGYFLTNASSTAGHRTVELATEYNVVIKNNTINFYKKNAQYAFYINNRNCGVDIEGNTITMLAGDNGSASSNGSLFYLVDVPNLTYTGNTTETVQSTQLRQYHLALIPSSTTWAGEATPIVNISNNTFKSRALEGVIVQIGQDGSGNTLLDNKWDGAVFEHNKIFAYNYFDESRDIDYVPVAAHLHGVLIGEIVKAKVRYNYINGSGYGFVMKGGQTQEQDWNHEEGVYGNILVNNVYTGVLNKGNKGLDIFNNSIYSSYDMVDAGAGIKMNKLDAGTLHGSNYSHIYNNIIYLKDPTNTDQLVSIYDTESAEGLEINNNIYWTESGSTKFFYTPSSQTSLAGWQSALPEATGKDSGSYLANPLFYDDSDIDTTENPVGLALTFGSPAIHAGVSLPAGVTLDYANIGYFSPPSIGALEADVTAPIVSGVTDGQITKTPLTITFNNGTATLNGASFVSGTVVSADGSYQLVVTDTYGNVTTVNFIIDNDTPNINISDPAHILVSTTASTYTIRGTMEDLLSGLASVDINGVGLSIASTDFTVNVNLVMGLNTFLITATDNAGNTGITPVYLTRTAVPIPTILPDRNSTIRRVFSPLAEVSTDQTVNSLEAANNDDSLISASDLTIFNGTEYETLVNGDATTYTELPIFRGKTTPNSKVFLQINGNEIINAETTSDSNGNWSYQVQQALSKGAHTLSITVKDQLDNILSTKLYNFTVAEKTDDQTANSSVWIYYAIGVFVLGFLLFLRIKPKNKQVSH